MEQVDGSAAGAFQEHKPSQLPNMTSYTQQLLLPNGDTLLRCTQTPHIRRTGPPLLLLAVGWEDTNPSLHHPGHTHMCWAVLLGSHPALPLPLSSTTGRGNMSSHHALCCHAPPLPPPPENTVRALHCSFQSHPAYQPKQARCMLSSKLTTRLAPSINVRHPSYIQANASLLHLALLASCLATSATRAPACRSVGAPSYCCRRRRCCSAAAARATSASSACVLRTQQQAQHT